MTIELVEDAQLLEEEVHRAAVAMQNHGGHFAAHLARAWFSADSTNRARLEGAFPDLFYRYSQWPTN